MNGDSAKHDQHRSRDTSAGPAPAEPERRLLGALDRVVHEPARLMILAFLFDIAEADFLFLLRETGLTAGNLGAHLARLEEAGYVAIEKSFRGKVPRTTCRITDAGRRAFESYRDQLARGLLER